MIASILVKAFLLALVLGVLALIPMILLNRKTSNTDRIMYKKDFSAKKELKSFRTSIQDKEPDEKKKLRAFKS